MQLELLNVDSPQYHHQKLQGVLVWGVEARHFVSCAFHIPGETIAYRANKLGFHNKDIR